MLTKQGLTQVLSSDFKKDTCLFYLEFFYLLVRHY